MASQGPLSPATVVSDSSHGAMSWAAPGNASSSDDTRAQLSSTISPGQISQYLKATNFSFSIPSGATIDGIVAEVEKLKSGLSNVVDDRVRIVKGGTVGATDRSSGSNWPTSDTYSTYGGTTDLWGETWTNTDINSSTFGFVIACRNSGASNPVGASIDHIRITVHYTTASGSAAQHRLLMVQ